MQSNESWLRIKVLVGSVFGLYVSYSAYKWWILKKHLSKLNEKVEARLRVRDKQLWYIQEITSELDPVLEQSISSLDIKELLESLKTGVYLCSDVLKVYQKRSLRSQELTNCITEYILEANDTAKKYDAMRTHDPNYKIPPLFGLPISIKANVSFRGRDQFKGYAQDLELPMEVDSVIVKHLQELGAIPFVLTNVPQTLLTYSCENPVYGSTSNPLSKERTSGGSSGGEAALIATGGSIIGIGSDTGGSVRIPATFCGIVGFKPTSRRLSNAGAPGLFPGLSHVFGSAGPMAADVRTCVKVLQAFWSQKWIHKYDAYIAPVDFDERMYRSTEKLRIGYFDSNECIEPVPAVKRALNDIRFRLERQGHELVHFRPPDAHRAYQLFLMAVAVDNGLWTLQKCDKDLPVKGYREMLMPLRWPHWFRRIIAFFLHKISKRYSGVIGSFHTNTYELLMTYGEIEAYWLTWKKLINELKLDCFICPTFPMPAMRHKEPYKMMLNCSYTSLFNLLDYPAGTLPVSKVTQTDIDSLEYYKAEDYFERLLVNSAKDTLGFPVGIQVVSLPYRDEMVLRVMREIEDLVRVE